jgi:hypothetical protein
MTQRKCAAHPRQETHKFRWTKSFKPKVPPDFSPLLEDKLMEMETAGNLGKEMFWHNPICNYSFKNDSFKRARLQFGTHFK